MSEKGRVREGAKRVSPSRVKANVRSPISLLCTQPSQRRPRFRDWRAGLTMVCTTSFTEHPVRFRSHSADPLRDRLAPPNSPRRKNPHPRPRCRDRPDMCVVLVAQVGLVLATEARTGDEDNDQREVRLEDRTRASKICTRVPRSSAAWSGDRETEPSTPQLFAP